MAKYTVICRHSDTNPDEYLLAPGAPWTSFEFVDFDRNGNEVYEMETQNADLTEIYMEAQYAIVRYERTDEEGTDQGWGSERTPEQQAEIDEDARLSDLEAGIHQQDEEYQRTVESEGAKLSAALETFIASPGLKEGVFSSTKAGFGGSHYSVELFPDGTHRVLWANQIGNLYQSDGVILALPQLDNENLQEIEGWTEEEVWNEAFNLEANEIEQSLRNALSD